MGQCIQLSLYYKFLVTNRSNILPFLNYSNFPFTGNSDYVIAFQRAMTSVILQVLDSANNILSYMKLKFKWIAYSLMGDGIVQ